MGIFTNNNIKIVQQSSKEYPPKSGIIVKRTSFLMGIDIPSDDNEIQEDDPE
jgi:hypothetical protein